MNTRLTLIEYMDRHRMNRDQRRDFLRSFSGLSVRKKRELVEWVADKVNHMRQAEKNLTGAKHGG
jgi:hypothetical protein